MAQIKSLDKLAAKWKRVAAGAAREYEEGVRTPRRDWATATAAAEGNYEAGVTAAMGRKAFGIGVSKTGTSGWQRNAIQKGPARFAQGVALAESAYREGFKPYHETIAGLELPARGPRGDPGNIERVRIIAAALHDKKLSLTGAS